MAESPSAIADLDTLLGDLEKSCQAKSGAAVDAHTRTPGQRPQPQLADSWTNDNTSSMAPTVADANTAANNAAMSQNINELDTLLQDLSNSRFSSRVEQQQNMSSTEYRSGRFATPPRTKESEAVIREMESSTKMVERREVLTTTSMSEAISDSKWEYMGYGIWENTDSEHEGGVSQRVYQPVQQASVRAASKASSPAPAVRPPPASSATQELDELMTSLNTFKVRSGRADEPVITNLDDMLGNLQEDMDKQGVRVTQKGTCFACQKPIVGQVITALGRTWHPEHFVCAHCNMELGSRNFFERDSKAFCEADYYRLFAPRCGKCGEAILDRCVSALDSTFHPACFTCASCKQQFGDGGYHERGGHAFCQTCFFSAYAPKCGGCSQPITAENYISSLDRQWHVECFVCAECRKPFGDGNYFVYDNKAYCEEHYHAQRGSLCASCQKAISGRCITAMGRKFHPEHFVCSFCLKQLNKGTFKERADKPYCHECHDRLFG